MLLTMENIHPIRGIQFFIQPNPQCRHYADGNKHIYAKLANHGQCTTHRPVVCFSFSHTLNYTHFLQISLAKQYCFREFSINLLKNPSYGSTILLRNCIGGTHMDKLQIFRKRYIPDECIFLKDDIIIHQDDEHIITKWK